MNSASRRQAQAGQTRREIVQAARALFAERGYAGTSIAEIARRARVSPQTIYDSVGSKANLVREMNELIDEAAGVGPLARAASTEEDPARLLAIPVEFAFRILLNAGDIVRAMVGAAQVEPDLAAVVREGARRRQLGAQRIAGRLAELGHLRVGLSREAAGETIAALADEVWWLRLQEDNGWPLERVRDWVRQSLARLLFEDEPGAAS